MKNEPFKNQPLQEASLNEDGIVTNKVKILDIYYCYNIRDQQVPRKEFPIFLLMIQLAQNYFLLKTEILIARRS